MSETSLRQVEPLVDAHVCMVIYRMREEMGERVVADIFKWWLFIATISVGELSFGQSFMMLELGKSPPFFRKAYQAGQRIVNYAQQSFQRYKSLVAVAAADISSNDGSTQTNPPKITFITKLLNAK
ncbi:hypothetical protein PAAG_11595 [Paracoccidioides lutzii Pb01]|uniref:Uncharacterized protein n=1 Tax=Paracoccidioides lutzii (strain ATCC MYA-826 / Pb01) TaxID=502779 RepID=A0A0A2VL78_PARBA|nr:hypothetical protein PAAG_11595 [Paracoccidioides lutzii Pb01]KGQ01614.1 hypothetical protein PAAG_11595 [Paracoccidioides lutzii Pb01]